MAENIQPPIAGEIQQPLEVPQGSQAEGEVNQHSSQGLPPPGAPEPDQPPANAHQKQTCRKKHDCLDICRFIVELVTLGVLLWYTIITNGLWIEADKANKQTRAIAQTADRPWVGFYEMGMEKFIPREKVKVRFVLQNSGKTPALEMKMGMRGGYTSIIPEGPPNLPLNILRGNGPVLMPGQTSDITFLSDEDLTEERFNSVMGKKDWVYIVWGKITYVDRFQGEGETTLCTYYIPELQKFGPCARGNSAK